MSKQPGERDDGEPAADEAAGDATAASADRAAGDRAAEPDDGPSAAAAEAAASAGRVADGPPDGPPGGPPDGPAPDLFFVGDERLAGGVAALRAIARAEGTVAAAKLRRVASLAADCEALVRRLLAAGPRVSGQPDDTQVIHTAVVGEVAAALGIAEGPAGSMLELARRLTRVLPAVLRALADGRLDLARARALAEATRVLDDATARRVADDLLDNAGSAPWDGPGPRAWQARVHRAVTAADPDAAWRRRQEAIAERAVRTWLNGDGTATLWLRAADVHILLAEQVITALALAWPAIGPDGQPLTMAQRRVEALLDIFRRLRDGDPLPDAARRRERGPGREVGIVLPADTLFGDGPAAADPGQLHGIGAPAPVDPRTAREMAETDIAAGAGVRVYLTDTHGDLIRLVRLMLNTDQPDQPGGPWWTRESLTAAVRAALPGLPALCTDRYSPTAAIIEHVRARNPQCSAFDCPRAARRCDLDHDTPWPRGPTDAANLCPRCRRHHEIKTRRLVHTRLSPDGTVDTTMLSGIVVTTRPEALPGYGPGEGYAQREAC